MSSVARPLLVILSVLILIGILLLGIVWFSTTENRVIHLIVEDEMRQSIEFVSLGLIPGQAIDYDIYVKSNTEGKYKLTLDFGYTDEEVLLSDHIYVLVRSGDDVLCDKLLKNAFSAEPITVESYLGSEPQKFSVIYYMPSEVGNEAQRLTATFDLIVSASNME